MSTSGPQWLLDAARAGVFHLTADPHQFAAEAAALGLRVYRVEIGHAHGKHDFLARVSRAMHFPDWFGGNWDAFADCLKDLSWTGADGPARGWVVILEKSKHYCDGHRRDFEEAVGALADAAAFWRGEGRPLWTLISGPDGWKSGWPPMPAA
ncbi:MAG: barstar family protein [Betaproteobacteria bacterium]|nr:barstar family protein [Betaproteobacteria bacterium]